MKSYIVYPKKRQASPICPLQKNKWFGKWFKQRPWKYSYFVKYWNKFKQNCKNRQIDGFNER